MRVVNIAMMVCEECVIDGREIDLVRRLNLGWVLEI